MTGGLFLINKPRGCMNRKLKYSKERPRPVAKATDFAMVATLRAETKKAGAKVSVNHVDERVTSTKRKHC